jgi:ribonuclease HII
MKTDYECATIIDDSDSSDEEYILTPQKKTKKVVKPKPIKTVPLLKKCHNENENVYEIGVDEAGRGPMFGRVYTAAVILPKDDSFDCSMVKDSKKFHSKKKIEEAAQYVKDNALAWYVSFEDEKKIDEINILQATQLSMHNSINEVRKVANNKMKCEGKEEKKDYNYNLLIDGNYFNPITTFNKKTNKLETVPYLTVEGGDNKYASIAAASILAKVERDNLMKELNENDSNKPYGWASNKGYGTKQHITAIQEIGPTLEHRPSFISHLLTKTESLF